MFGNEHSNEPVSTLASLPAFRGCARRELEHVASLGTPIRLPAGARIMLQGTVARECFVIERGTVAVTADGHEVATAGPGSFLGEDTLLHGLVRTETAIATVPVDLIVFDAREFTTLLETVPVLAERLRRPLPSGLNEAAARATEVRRSSPVAAGA